MWSLKFVLFSVAVYFLNTLTYGNFNSSKIIARVTDYDSYRIPVGSSLMNISPKIDDLSNITFIVKWVEASSRHGLWLGNEKMGSVVYRAAEDHYFNGPVLRDGGVYFTLNKETSFGGIFHYKNSKLKTIIGNKDLKNTISVSNICFSNKEMFFRSKTWDGQLLQSFNGTLKTLFSDQNGISYFFGTSCSKSGVYFKGRVGKARQWGEDQPDVIFSYLNGSLEKQVEDQDANSVSLYKSFQNSVGSSVNNHLVFISTLLDGRKAVVLRDPIAGSDKVLVKEGEYNLKSIEYFRPSVNIHKTVVFRGIDTEGKRNIFAIKNDKLISVLRESDLVKTDRENAIILFRKKFPGISGSPALNNKNEIVSHVLLTTKDGEEFLGEAVYLSKILD